MSVINQMLKDLDKRTPEQGQTPAPVITGQNPSTLKVVLISVVVLLILNALGFYIMNLQEQASKQLQEPQVSSVKLPVEKKAKVIHLQEQKQEQKQELQVSSVKLSVEKKAQVIQLQAQQPQVSSVKLLVEKKEQAQVKATEVSVLPSTKVAKMSVSRRQLTSKELVTQKLTRAEKAVNLNEITKAEQLFEDVLIIEPEHKQARKKLAALWFGRKSYQQAVNLLSQGIAIDKQDGELRLLKARIHLSQGQHEIAFNTLKPLASFEQEEYQIMLANIAQKIELYSSAINAYQVLIKMQPYSGRWHLGVAIVYDKNGQFSLAVNEYALALTKTDLSASSAKFAQQRMQALGE